MKSEDVLSFYDTFTKNGITVWVDGGWCIDALLGRQTREHSDLDIAVERKDNDKLRKLLESMGYDQEVMRPDSTEWEYVLKNNAGKEIDIHAFQYDEDNNSIWGVKYPFGSLTGTGVIDGQEVNCINPEWMFKFKTAYTPKEKDLQDVRALSEAFGFELPETHQSK